MGECIRTVIACFIVFFWGTSNLFCLAAEPIQTKKVLILYSFAADVPVQGLFTHGLQKGLRQDDGYKIDYVYEYLDMSRFSEKDYGELLSRYLREKYGRKQPDLIISYLEPASNFMASYGEQIFPGVPTIRGLYEGESESYQNPPVNYYDVVGIYGMTTAIDLILQAQPNTKKIYVAAGDGQRERKAIASFTDVALDFTGRVEFVYLNKLPLEEMLSTIKEISGDSVILYFYMYKDAAGNAFIPGDVLQKIHEVAPVPIYSSVSVFIGRGTVGGYMSSQDVLGNKVAAVALDILRGNITSHGPIEKAVAAEYIFDWRELKRWGIDENKLPSESKIEFKEKSIWELYKWQILVGTCLVSIQGILIVILLLNRRVRRRTETALKQSEEKYRLFIENANDAVFIYELLPNNSPGKFLEVNDMACKRLGYTKEEFKNMTFGNINLPNFDLEKAQDFLAQIRISGRGSFETIHVTKDGTYIPVEVSACHIIINQHAVIFSLARDLTERKKAENRLKAINQELDQFAYIVSHDLRAPLRAISSLSIWMEEDLAKLSPPDEIHTNMELLRRRVQRMDNFIQGILQYSRAGRVKGAIEVCDVGELLEDIKEDFNLQPPFRMEFAANMPVIKTESLKLRQVLANLLDNAMKHHNRLDGFVHVSVRDLGEFYEFSVRDDGPGIAPQYHNKVFQIFQVLQPRDQKENTGIGLALVKKIVEDQGGTIILQSDSGEGATFIFTWPKKQNES
ncbi:ABC transporter substrate binding protein [Pelosinus sp. sgz500959]|uniref:ABC transporter substrate binding protein n=1 Tax=Pelosinus sp. sgz500959 TaxID=3242472 RepID=UPI00366BE8DC